MLPLACSGTSSITAHVNSTRASQSQASKRHCPTTTCHLENMPLLSGGDCGRCSQHPQMRESITEIVQGYRAVGGVQRQTVRASEAWRSCWHRKGVCVTSTCLCQLSVPPCRSQVTGFEERPQLLAVFPWPGRSRHRGRKKEPPVEQSC